MKTFANSFDSPSHGLLSNVGVRKLLLVDDHGIIREGIKRILEPVSASWQVIEAANGFEALELLRAHAIALAIVDLSLPGMAGLDLIKRIKAEYANIPVLVLSMHAEEQYAMRAFKAGATGYLTKDSASDELVSAIRKVSAGGAFVTASLAERLVQQLSGAGAGPSHSDLSDRELDILRRIVAGQRMTDIADSLRLSVKTVSTHKAHIQEKLQLRNTAELIRYGLEHLVGDSEPSLGR